MRMALYVLLVLNLLVAALIWLSMRQQANVAQYSHPEQVREISLLKIKDSDAGGATQLGGKCWLLGPMVDKVPADALLATLLTKGLPARLVDAPKMRAPAYQLYLGPYADYAQAKQKLAELQSRSLDSYVIARGGLRNAISLGVFDNVDSAKGQRKFLQKKGYQVQQREVPRQTNMYWLALEKPLKPVQATDFDRFLGEKGALVQSRKIFCK